MNAGVASSNEEIILFPHCLSQGTNKLQGQEVKTKLNKNSVQAEIEIPKITTYLLADRIIRI
ncbi:MAG: hypothetical protein LBR43_00810 [Spiroplasmataceae bacterium]|nr:hypothetical protein [Spiroplasmataceae bacterium]